MLSREGLKKKRSEVAGAGRQSDWLAGESGACLPIRVWPGSCRRVQSRTAAMSPFIRASSLEPSVALPTSSVSSARGILTERRGKKKGQSCP